MSNFGFSRLRVVAPYEAAFREARSAVGASALLAGAQEYSSVAEALADCALVVGTTAARHRQLLHPLLPLEQGARLIRQQLPSGRVALLFGSEKRGLSNRDLSHCHWLLRLPTREEHPSMNLGQAVAVCLYELARDRTPTSAKSLKDRRRRSRRTRTDHHGAAPGAARQRLSAFANRGQPGKSAPPGPPPGPRCRRRRNHARHAATDIVEAAIGRLSEGR